MKRSVTLIEMMIVILLIGLIGGALAFNMRGSMDKGRQFKTEQHISRVHDILMMECAKGVDINEVVEKKEQFLKASGLVKDAEKMLKDGWGADLEFRVEDEDILITSRHG